MGLLGALLSAGVVSAFEADLAEQVTIALFLPGVVYVADAVGTQTEALIIRGLSVGVSVRQVAWRESVTGLVVGAAIAALFIPTAALLWGDTRLAVAVGIALLGACSVGPVVALVLPALLARAGADPAFGRAHWRRSCRTCCRSCSTSSWWSRWSAE